MQRDGMLCSAHSMAGFTCFPSIMWLNYFLHYDNQLHLLIFMLCFNKTVENITFLDRHKCKLLTGNKYQQIKLIICDIWKIIVFVMKSSPLNNDVKQIILSLSVNNSKSVVQTTSLVWLLTSGSHCKWKFLLY